MKKTLIIAAITASFSINALAEIPNTFEAGNAIVAAEMNENFTALQNQINDLKEQLEGLQSTSQSTYTELLSDSTYSGQFIFFGYASQDAGDGASFGHNIGGSSPEYGLIGGVNFMKGGGSVTLTLNSDGSISNYSGEEAEIEGDLALTCQNYDDESASCAGEYSNDAEQFSDSWSDAVTTSTWQVNEATGMLTIFWDEEDSDQFRISEDGSVLYSLSYNNDADNYRQIENSVVILSRKK